MIEGLVRNADPRFFRAMEHATDIVMKHEMVNRLISNNEDFEGSGVDVRHAAVSMSDLLDCTHSISSLLEFKNHRILDLFKSFSSYHRGEESYQLSSLMGLSLVLCIAADRCKSIRRTSIDIDDSPSRSHSIPTRSNKVPTSSNTSPATDTYADTDRCTDTDDHITVAASLFMQSFCVGSVSTRISLLSCILSLGDKALPDRPCSHGLSRHINPEFGNLLGRYEGVKGEKGLFLLPTWAVQCESGSQRKRGGGGSVHDAKSHVAERDSTEEQTALKGVPFTDLFTDTLTALAVPSFVHSLLLFGVFSADGAVGASDCLAPSKNETDRNSRTQGDATYSEGGDIVSRRGTDRGREGGRGRGSRRSRREREEATSDVKLRLSRLSTALLDLLLLRVMAVWRGEGLGGGSSEGARVRFRALYWAHSLSLLKLLEWKSYTDEAQGQGQGQGRNVYRQSVVSSFVQQLEEYNTTNTTNTSSSSAYGRAMVLGLFHCSAAVRASSALRLRHELSGLTAPCEDAVRHTHSDE